MGLALDESGLEADVEAVDRTVLEWKMKTGIKSIEDKDFEEIQSEVIQLEWLTKEFRIQCPTARIDSTDTIGHPMRMWEWGRALLALKEKFGYPFPKGTIDILDIGTAVSLLGPALSYLGCNVQETDVDKNWEEERLKLKSYLDNFADAGSFNWIQMGFGRLHELAPLEYDVVMSISTIEHVETSLELKAWKEMADRTKLGGLLIVTMDCFKTAKKGYKYDDVRFTNFDLKLVKARVEELKSYGFVPVGKEDYRWHGIYVDDGSFASIHMVKG